ncbi:DUF4440 domain-containing protein [Miniimonas arenae]|uniref:DUF4440 domain-containing protein n=1 Tax=Miniimonas arenae TaxID=676201 RepID=A0A5C5BA37_9MICO|nr:MULTISPECIES: nuclear transport factor 2 family protein [Miniimonas]TNU73374.1 DUF4440 domain-containing protein [Miniimonas arenae]
MSDHPAPDHVIRADTASDAVVQLARAYSERAGALDVDAFLTLYDPDVVVFDLAMSASGVGLDSWRRGVESWFGMLEPGQRNIAEITDVTVLGDGPVVAAHARARYAVEGGEAGDGEDAFAMINRLTWVVRQGDDGVWRIVHEHTSAPIELETGKAIFG